MQWVMSCPNAFSGLPEPQHGFFPVTASKMTVFTGQECWEPPLQGIDIREAPIKRPILVTLFPSTNNHDERQASYTRSPIRSNLHHAYIGSGYG